MWEEEKEKTIFDLMEEFDKTFAEADRMNEEQKQQATKTRKRKSKEEVLTALNDKRQKLLEELSKVDNQIEKKKMTPEEKKEIRRKIDTRCKIIAGATIIKMIKGKEAFDLGKFKQDILATTCNPDDQAYFAKVFND